MNRDDIIDWLLENQALTLEIIEKTNKRANTVDYCFYDDAKDQWLEIIKEDLLLELSITKGLTTYDLDGIISEVEFKNYISEVMKDES